MCCQYNIQNFQIPQRKLHDADSKHNKLTWQVNHYVPEFLCVSTQFLLNMQEYLHHLTDNDRP